MNRCKQCSIRVADDAVVCPLCNSVLELDGTGKREGAMYPDIAMHTRIYKKLVRIFTACALLIEILLVVINVLTFSGVWWSVICAAAFLYLLLTLKFSVSNYNHGHILKIAVQAIGIVLFSFLIDHIIGYRGWSLNFAMPLVIILVDIATVILMIVNNVNWQAYLLLQLAMIAFSALGIVFCLTAVVSKPLLTLISAGASLVLFLGTLLIGDKKATNELIRRFHV